MTQHETDLQVPPAIASDERTILVVGTYDTKSAELGFLEDVIRAQGGRVIAMDVSILGATSRRVDISKHAVAQTGGATIAALAALGEESQAISVMARGASQIAAELVASGRAHGMIALGGTMGTDLALDVALALPLGVPKYIVSTVAFSPIISPARLAPDVQMILWAGGLYGLNTICRSTLAQAGGAVVGATRSAVAPRCGLPMIGVTSLGNTCLSYIRLLKPALEQRGFSVAVFHSTGMGGRAFESLAAKGSFVAVFDLCMQELGNELFGSMVSSGPDRLRNAGRSGVPQIVAPGAADLVDWPSWQPRPRKWRERPVHVHNQLISSFTLDAGERRMLAREMALRLNAATGPVHVVLPLQGIEAWDREDEVAHAPADLGAFYETLQQELSSNVPMTLANCHINDPGFVEAALMVFDKWRVDGLV